eukprot:2021696-Pleurochrysis_carterae.AAC.1
MDDDLVDEFEAAQQKSVYGAQHIQARRSARRSSTPPPKTHTPGFPVLARARMCLLDSDG